ncbi:hypothetical protein EV189_2497 [Motilibacter rhizosphaerae]|uniref:Parallel beta helix pectate lyase-like protein n=1 Tax=Motilibacter rhizosphaerae TaxID=598652 RepID=A0A4Q7NP82_9ACTN|nr:hypothetical protein [Motilibacter rhizosphaerae]RZS87075.1 hypothetical protein EV189_2497 [Motilibacter rhizosphaerae]
MLTPRSTRQGRGGAAVLGSAALALALAACSGSGGGPAPRPSSSTPGPTSSAPTTTGPTTTEPGTATPQPSATGSAGAPSGPATPLPTPSAPESPVPAPKPLRVVRAADSAALRAALRDARPGDRIDLVRATYTGPFVVSESGTAADPVVLTGARQTVITTTGGSPLTVTGSHVRVKTAQLRAGSAPAVVVAGGQDVTLDRLTVLRARQAGVRVTGGARLVYVLRSSLGGTSGPAVQVGAAGAAAQPSDVLVDGCTVVGQGVVVAAGATGGGVHGTSFSRPGGPWVRLLGSGWIVDDNTGDAPPSGPALLVGGPGDALRSNETTGGAAAVVGYTDPALEASTRVG